MIPPSEDPPAGSLPSPPTLPASATALPDLATVRARFTVDFVEGRVGQQHNTFRHRERVLRQLTAQAQLRGH